MKNSQVCDAFDIFIANDITVVGVVSHTSLNTIPQGAAFFGTSKVACLLVLTSPDLELGFVTYVTSATYIISIISLNLLLLA